MSKVQCDAGLLEWSELGYKVCIALAFITKLWEDHTDATIPCVMISTMDGRSSAYTGIPYYVIRDALYAFNKGENYQGYEVPEDMQ